MLMNTEAGSVPNGSVIIRSNAPGALNAATASALPSS
jgi:hypothetical protein